MSITVAELDELVAKIKLAREKESELSRLKKEASDELALLEGQIIEHLNNQNLTSFRGTAGTVSISHRTSVKKPVGDDAQAFYSYLKEKGLYDSMVSVNSQTLNAYYKAAMNEAVERGNADFAIPGLNEVTINETLSFRKA